MEIVGTVTLDGSSSGSVDLSAPASGGSGTAVLPITGGTLCPQTATYGDGSASFALTAAMVQCPGNTFDNTGQSGHDSLGVWPTKTNSQSIMVSVATTVATTYKFEVDFGTAVAYPNGNHTTAYRYCGYAATNVTEGNYFTAQCKRSDLLGASNIACDVTDGVGAVTCRNP